MNQNSCNGKHVSVYHRFPTVSRNIEHMSRIFNEVLEITEEGIKEKADTGISNVAEIPVRDRCLVH